MGIRDYLKRLLKKLFEKNEICRKFATLRVKGRNINTLYQMKRKLKFVSPKVTRAVPLYPETDMMQVIPGSTMYDQTLVSTGIGVENYEAESYLEYE